MLAPMLPALKRASASYSASSKVVSEIPVTAIFAYAGLLAVSWGFYDLVAGRRWTFILTLSAIVHCFGLVLLCIQVVSSRSAIGVSARALFLDGVAVSLRLSSTLFYEGYKPNDRTGDFVYQCVDISSLVLISFLLRSVLVTYRSTYQEADDDISTAPLVLICLLSGALLHGDMDDNVIFDTLWLAGLFVSVVAVLPQYWMISKSGGQTQALTAHYIAATAVDRALSGMFMWYVRMHITCEPLIGGFSHTIVAILAAHFFHLVLLSDFMFFYARALVTQPCGQSVGFTV